MSEVKTVEEILAAVDNPKRQADARELLALMQEVTGEEPKVWGTMIGFGHNHYKYDSGREGDIMAVGFAPRKPALSVYGLKHYDFGQGLAGKLGPHEEGKGCIYIKDLSAVDKGVLKQMIAEGYKRFNNAT
jgi:hypothetical protein